MDESILENMVRVGIVHSVESSTRRVRVYFDELAMVSEPLFVLRRGEGWLPSVDERVLVLYFPIFDGDGFVLGGI